MKRRSTRSQHAWSSCGKPRQLAALLRRAVTNGPWEWRPSASAWAATLIGRVDRWEPARALRLDAERIRTVIADGARAGSSWLRHPLVSRLTKPGPADSYRDLAVAAWVAAATRSDLGEVELTEQVLLWSGAGDQVIDAGRHELSALGALMAEPPPVPLALDLWCRATGVVTPGSWPALPPSAAGRRIMRC